ncbi:helix-turn-helix domain-containing protein [Actinomadura luteofluorescens]|uniref:helix-turn-helix domain-containing protein n=1 Tax=Actinomadura luteofluorescens TaxID=46163 RepID=UPI00363561E8
MENKPPYPLRSVDNALHLLQVLRDQGGLRVSEAAAELGTARSTAHRLLAMLVYRGFAVQDDNHTYLPGPPCPPPACSAGRACSGCAVLCFRIWRPCATV